LALGAAIGTLAVLTKAELLLPLIGGIYVVEAVGHRAGGLVQAHGAPRLPHGAAAPPLRIDRLARAQDRGALLDRVVRAGAAGADHAEVTVVRSRRPSAAEASLRRTAG